MEKIKKYFVKKTGSSLMVTLPPKKSGISVGDEIDIYIATSKDVVKEGDIILRPKG